MKKDAQGFVWFGTHGALNRYDGNRFEYFLHDPDDSTTISNNDVHSFYEDGDFLWMGTTQGLNRFDKRTLKFKRFPISYKNDNGEFQIRSIESTSDSTLWLGTYGKGLFHINKEGQLLHHYSKSNSNLPSDFINALYENEGELFLGTAGEGLITFDLEKKSFKKVITHHKKLAVQQIKEHKGKLWVATWGNGVLIYDLTKKVLFEEITTQNSDLADNTVRNLLFHKNEAWFGTVQGISILNMKNRTMRTEVYKFEQSNVLPHNFIWCLEKEDDGIWIGTFGGGISRYKFSKQNFQVFNAQNSNGHLNGNNVVCNFLDSREIVWVFTRDYGLEALDASDKFKPIHFDILKECKKLKITSISETKAGNLILAGEKGIFLISKDLKRITKINDGKHSFNGAVFYDIKEDDEGNLWIGGWNKGLIKINMNASNPIFEKYGIPEGMPSETVWRIVVKDSVTLLVSFHNKFVEFDIRTKKIKSTIINGKVTSVFVRKDTVWFSTETKGIYKKEINSDSLITIPVKFKGVNLSASDFTMTERNLWLATSCGLYKYDESGEKSQIFTSSDGLSTQTFIRNTAINAKNGNLLIGTEHGLISWNESGFLDHPKFPSVYYSKLALEDSIIFDGYQGLNNQEFQFSYDRNYFSLQVSTIDHLNTALNHIEYKVGKEGKWVVLNDLQEQISLIGLSPGKYIINVRVASNVNESYGTTTSLTLKISPPFWNTWWFRLMFILIVAISAIAFYLFRMYQVKLRNEWLEDEVKERTEDLLEQNEELSLKNAEIQNKVDTILSQQKRLVDGVGFLDEIKDKKLKDAVLSLKGMKVMFSVEDSNALDFLNKHLCDIFEIVKINPDINFKENISSLEPDLVIFQSDQTNVEWQKIVGWIKETLVLSHVKLIMVSPEKIEGGDAFYDGVISMNSSEEEFFHCLVDSFSVEKNGVTSFLLLEQDKILIEGDHKDTEFISDLVSYVEENLNNSDLNGTTLCREFAMSKSVLYRKLKILTGLTVNELIRIIRLRKGYKLLREGGHSISSVAIEVGFNSIPYFTSSFRKLYGKTPSEVL